MRKLFLFFTLMATSFSCFSQIENYDARMLATFVNRTVQTHKFKAEFLTQAVELIKKYYPDIPNTDRDQIIALIKTPGSPQFNPILAEYLDLTVALAPANIGIAKSLFSAVGNLDVTNFADGLAKFLVERSKEELNIAFFRKFQEYLKNYPEAQILFSFHRKHNS